MKPRHGVSTWTWAAVLVCALAAAWGPGVPASAQAPPPAPFQATAGPYHITLEQRLSGLSLGRAEFFVTVQELATSRPVTDAHVSLWLQSPRTTERARSLALGGPETPGRYSARVNLDSPGAWLVAVEVSGPLGTASVEAPPVEVPSTRRFTSGSLVFIGVTLVLVAGGLYVYWSARRARRNAVAAAPPQETG